MDVLRCKQCCTATRGTLIRGPYHKGTILQGFDIQPKQNAINHKLSS